LGRFPFPFRSSRPNPLQTAAHQTLPLSLLSITRRQPGPACRPTALPYPHLFFPHLRFASHRPACVAGVRGMERPPRPAGPHAELPVARVSTSRSRPRWVFPLLPPRRAPLQLGLRGGDRCHLGRPSGQSRGSLGLSHRRSRHRASKARRGRDPGCQSHQPLWGFRFLLIPPCESRERRGAAAALRRKSRARTGCQELDAGKAVAVDIYLTGETLFPKPATPTLSTHREYHRGCTLLSFPLVTFL
jgi:hypothetical protein